MKYPRYDVVDSSKDIEPSALGLCDRYWYQGYPKQNIFALFHSISYEPAPLSILFTIYQNIPPAC